MENANSTEYLDKIKAAVMENLRHTGPVPSVQMQDIPPSFGAMTDEEEAELEDLSEDTHKDVRMSLLDHDKRRTNEAEYEESEDEDGGKPPSRRRSGGKQRNFESHKDKSKSEEAEKPVESGAATPANNGTADAAEAEDPDVTIEDAPAPETINAPAADRPEKKDESINAKSDDENTVPTAEADTEKPQAEPAKKDGDKEMTAEAVDADGDVGMEDAVIKKEDAPAT